MDFAVVGEVIAERYELQELVGTGGMSNVYRAHDGRQFIVFEHVAGENLKELVRSTGPLHIRQAIDLALQVGRALSFAHEHGLIHRDVKPQNVLLNGDGRAKVTDFGIARTLDVEGVTQSGVVLGTSHYISPEQATGDSVEAHSDVYSLGAVLYELLTGDVPFPGDNFVTVAMRHVREPVPNVLEQRPETPLRLVAAVERALAKNPAERFASMHEFVDELEACRGQLGEEGENEPTMIVRSTVLKESRPRTREPERRRLWPLVLLVAGLAIAAIAAGLFLFRDSLSLGSDDGSTLSAPVKLRAVGAYDPFGDGTENDGEVANATDRNLDTYWPTEHYYDGLAAVKQGVGLMLDAGRSVSPK